MKFKTDASGGQSAKGFASYTREDLNGRSKM